VDHNSKLSILHSQLVLLVEDNRRVQMNNREILERHGYKVLLAMNLAETRAAVRARMPDVIVLDLALPDGNGLDFLAELRKTSGVPVLVLTADQTPEKSSESLDVGSDDFLRKPYSLKEFRARVDALMRRAARVPETVAKGAFTLDMTKMTAYANGEDMLLTGRDFFLLKFFLERENQFMAADYIYETVWGAPMAADDSAVKNAVSRLRKKMSGTDRTIVFDRGKGCYRFGEES
jgi:DNA-binding response OmpR family regulator